MLRNDEQGREKNTENETRDLDDDESKSNTEMDVNSDNDKYLEAKAASYGKIPYWAFENSWLFIKYLQIHFVTLGIISYFTWASISSSIKNDCYLP